MTEHEEDLEYDPRAFQTLLGSTDATLLSPLFDRAASALKVFIQEGPQPENHLPATGASAFEQYLRRTGNSGA